MGSLVERLGPVDLDPLAVGSREANTSLTSGQSSSIALPALLCETGRENHVSTDECRSKRGELHIGKSDQEARDARGKQ